MALMVALIILEKKMSGLLKISTEFVNSKITSRVCQAACTHIRNWSSRNENKNVINITRIYNDEDGKSHFGTLEIELNGSGDIGYLSSLIPGTGVIFRQTPASYLYKWHNAPARQFIVNLDAEVEIEVSDGEKRILKQGEVFFVEDLHGKGHFSSAVNNKFRSSLFIPVTDEFKTN